MRVGRLLERGAHVLERPLGVAALVMQDAQLAEDIRPTRRAREQRRVDRLRLVEPARAVALGRDLQRLVEGQRQRDLEISRRLV